MFESRINETYLSKLPEALRGVDFPASRDELVEMAEMNGAAPVLADRLKDLPDRGYDNISQLLAELGILEA